MNTIKKFIEVLANIAIIVVAILLVAVLVKNHPSGDSGVRNVSQTRGSNEGLRIGEKIKLPDINWKQNGRTLVLALSTTCHFCSESAPFYQRLIKERSPDTSIIAVLPQTIGDSKQYLNRLGVSVNDIKQVQFPLMRITATPTLLLVDGNGVVEGVWIGKLPNSEEVTVLSRVRQSTAKK